MTKIGASTTSIKAVEGKRLYQYLAALTATLPIITSGMHYAWPSPSLLKLEASSDYNITNDQGSWIAVMPLLGCPVGSLVAAALVDILGRKKTILVASFPFFAAWVMVAFSKSVLLLSSARFLAGIADGFVFTVVPMYIGEIADPEIRGLLGSGVSVTWIFGILLINIVGSYLSITTTALVSSVLPVLGLLTFAWMPESPYHLLMRGNHEQARCNLQKFRGKDDVETDLSRISKAVKAQTTNTGKFLDLFTVKSNRKAVYIITALRTAQQLSGIAAITFYTHLIFKEAGSDMPTELAAIIYFSVQLLMTIVCSGIVDRAGRIPLLLISLAGSALALFLEGSYFFVKTNTEIEVGHVSYLPVISHIAFVVFFSLGMQSIPVLMLGELFPTNVKAFALSLADIYFAVMATIVSKFFQIVKDKFGMYVPFYVFMICCLLGMVLVKLFVPETKGKSLEDIQHFLGGESGRSEEDEKCEQTEMA